MNERTVAESPSGSLEERVGRIEALLDRDSWAGRPIVRGALPFGVVRDVLPAAAVEFRFAYITIRGATAVADVTYQCLKDIAEAYAWEVVATGA